jgi:hypothetical protein
MEYDRTPATKALRKAERKQKMKEYRKANRKANREQRKHAKKEKERIEMLKRRELEKREYYKTEKGQKQYYTDNLEELIQYYNQIVNFFKKDVKSVFESSSSLLSVYAQSYNVLRIMSGMSGLTYDGDSSSSISSSMSADEIKLSSLNTDLERARKNVYDTITGKHKIGINKEIHTKMLAKTMAIPYELANIINHIL